MTLLQILIPAIFGFIGTLVGGIISYKIMTKQFELVSQQEFQKQKRDDELYLKRKKEETAIKMIHLLYKGNRLFSGEVIQGASKEYKEWGKDIIIIKTDVFLYLSRKWNNKFFEILDKIDKTKTDCESDIEIFTIELKSELGIES